MKERNIKAKAVLFLIGFVALVMTAQTVAAEPQTGDAGETQSMIIIGCALAMGIAGVGSALGLMLAGTSAVAVTAEKPELFGRCLVFQVLPMTQAVYGLLTAILLMMSRNGSKCIDISYSKKS
jgi:V/A-type H+-transporting ATPase subunit K